MPQNCTICLVNIAKYTCPACKAKTCSATCVSRHKKQAQCSGLVDASRFIPKSELAEAPVHINRDYNFLMQIGRNISVGKSDVKANAKNVLKRERTSNFARNKRRTMPSATAADRRLDLVAQAFPNNPETTVKRQNTLVVLLPEGMARASSNKTGYDKKQQCFTWTVQWVFVDADGNKIKELTSYRASEAGLLKDIFPLNSLGSDMPENTDREGLHFYLKNVVDPRNVVDLDRQSSLADALQDVVILEYPSIYVSAGHVNSFNVVSREDAYKPPEESECSSSDSSDSDSESDSSSDSEESTDSSDNETVSHQPQQEEPPKPQTNDTPTEPSKSSNLSAAESIARFLQRSRDAQPAAAQNDSDDDLPEESSSKPNLNH